MKMILFHIFQANNRIVGNQAPYNWNLEQRNVLTPPRSIHPAVNTYSAHGPVGTYTSPVNVSTPPRNTYSSNYQQVIDNR